ncbi:MAG: phospho-N-acetylmuramoyl-pentapeptide-transferase [Pirellulales bacterium]
MLLFLIDRLLARWPDLCDPTAWSKITPRAGLAALASFALALVCGPQLIAWLGARFREPNKSASPEVVRLHQAKSATPTMGGLFIVGGIVAAALLLGDWSNPYLPIALLLVVSLAVLGAYDDLVKMTTASCGAPARTKLIAQTAIGLSAAVMIYRLHDRVDGGLDLSIPFTQARIALGWWFVPLATLVIVASSNAVNLADGLDGLAGGCLVCATGAMALVVYAAGHAAWAAHLHIAHIPGAGEMAVVAAAMIGGLLGFLWFNCHPASVFMGDTGSLPLGGLLGLLAVISRQELLLVAIGGVFVVEAASVIMQVIVYRWRKRRILLCAPVHHHFQLRGWSEDKIVVRFWIAGALCAIVGLAGLKWRPAAAPETPQLTAVQRVTR